MSKYLNNIAIYASGNGTNAINILDCVSENLKETSVNCLITDQENAGIISKMKDHPLYHDIPVVIIPFTLRRNKCAVESYSDAKKRHESMILESLQRHHVDWITLAGYMRILSSDFLTHFYDKNLCCNRVINIHPSLLPKFPGKDAYELAFQSNDYISGATVHFVDSGIDTGEIILQQSFVRKREDSIDDFKRRGLQIEYQIYKKALILLDEKIQNINEEVQS